MAPFALLGAALRTLRRRAGHTRQQLALAAGVSAGAIGRYERGLQQPPTPTLERLLDALGSDLLGFHQILCAGEPVGEPGSAHRGSRRARLAEIQRETEELTRLLDELAHGAALLLKIVTQPHATAKPGRVAEMAVEPSLLGHLHHPGLLDRWAIEPTSELCSESAGEPEGSSGERAVDASTLADQVARVERTLRQLRRRISFYQRSS